MILVLAAREWRMAVQARWFWFYGAATALLGAALLWMAAGMLPAGVPVEVAGSRVLMAAINLLALLVPLMGLTAGAQSLAGERDRRTLGYLLSQPVSRAEVLTGKLLGNALALLAAVGGATLIQLTLSLVIDLPVPAGALLAVAGLAWLLGLCSLALGAAIGSGSAGLVAAQGGMIVAWLLMALLGDLGLMGMMMIRAIPVKVLLFLTFLNPVHQFRVAAVALLRPTLEVLGPVGIYAQERLGTALAPALLASLIAWTAAASLVALERFRRSRSAS